jgi:hypothetical protein
MNMQFLRKSILAVVGTTFAVSLVVVPVLGSSQHNPRSIAASTVSVEAADAEQNVAVQDEATTEVGEQPVDVDSESNHTIAFSGEAGTVTKAELEAITGEATDKIADSRVVWENVEPTIVAKAKARTLGLNPQNDKFVHIGDKDGKSEVLVNHGDQKYVLTLAFVPGKGWVLVSSREIVDTVKPSDKIIMGTVKPNRQKLADLQKIVDYGYQLWRLDPLQVAKYQGEAFGFNQNKDSFELMPSIMIYREYGEATVLVKHNKKYYQIHLQQPFGNGKDNIWTIDSVKEAKSNGDVSTPTIPASGTIYSNKLVNNWSWSKSSLPQDMAFTAVINLDDQRAKDNRFRNDIWNTISSYDHENNVLLLAYLGAMPTGGYDIGISKVSVHGRDVTVQVSFKSPSHGNSVTMATTYPFDVVLIPKNKLLLDQQVTFKFVDTNGKLLTTLKATVSQEEILGFELHPTSKHI